MADNISAAGVVLAGQRHALPAVRDLADLRCEVAIGGEVVHEALDSAILGNPLVAVMHLAAHLGRTNTTLPAGSVVLAGALTDAVSLVTGHSYELSIAHLGSIVVNP